MQEQAGSWSGGVVECWSSECWEKWQTIGAGLDRFFDHAFRGRKTERKTRPSIHLFGGNRSALSDSKSPKPKGQEDSAQGFNPGNTHNKTEPP
jgi:hypothetical protein